MTRLIIDSGNEYLIKLKGNQPRLLAAVQDHMAEADPLDEHAQAQTTRGRCERRHTEVYTAPPGIDPGWIGLQRVIRVRRFGHRRGRPYERVSYYISSLTAGAGHLAEAVRGHWSIENRLHWVKDVGMNEDRSGIRGKTAAANLSLLKSWGLTLYRRGGYDSLKEAVALFTNKVKELLQLMRT